MPIRDAARRHGIYDRLRSEGNGLVDELQALVELLNGFCSNDVGGKELHRHIRLVDTTYAKLAQVYPPKVVKAILKNFKEQLLADGHLSAR